MATIPPPVGSDGKINFPNMLGTKRRRMRSGGNVSTVTNNVPKPVTTSADDGDEKVADTSRCKGATTIPIFLKKTYKMIETCDPNIASWYVLFCQYGLQAIREHEISQITHDD